MKKIFLSGENLNIYEKIEKVKNIVKGKKIAIAFSGGADSTFLSYIAKEVSEDILTVTFNNGLMDSSFLNDVEKIAKSIDVKHEVVFDDLLENQKFIKNDNKRCFICRNIMYSKIKEIAIEKGFDKVCDGTNISDLLEDRPGIIANYENNILSPLVKAGIEKKDVVNYLNENHVNYLKSTTCLGTRIKTNEEISGKKINRINYAENLLKNITKSEVVRVRDNSNTAEIEVENIDSLLNKNTLNLINNELKAINFEKITLNIGSLENSQKEMIIYKPCKDKENIMFENELPYEIDLEKTYQNLNKIGKVKYSKNLGLLMIDLEDKNISIFEKGKIVARKVKNKEDAEKILIKILPNIYRKL